MLDTPALNKAAVEEAKKPSCSVCWQDFGHDLELDDHIRSRHPDRIGKQEDLFAPRHVA